MVGRSLAQSSASTELNTLSHFTNCNAHHDVAPERRNGMTVLPAGADLARYSAHASMNRRRFSNLSPRSYACSVLLPNRWASASSLVSFAKAVASPAHVLKLDRIPCVVTLDRGRTRDPLRAGAVGAIGRNLGSTCRRIAVA